MSLESYLWDRSIETQAISLNPDAALQAAIFADGLVPVGTEMWVDYDDERYAYMAAEALTNPDSRRVYYAKVPNWDDVRIVASDDLDAPDPLMFDIGRYFLPDDGNFSPVFLLSNN